MVRKKITKKEIMLVVFCTIFIISILTFYIWHQVEAVRSGYEINRLEEKVQNLQIEVEELEAEKSARLSLEEVERIAKEKLKMVETEESQKIYEEFRQQ
ncbi:MAG: cell division protein FtsL [Candidatus Aminicenantes bacterium]|nr:cell division protein FtsL [Candidatus Aminicenantes bacterium]